LCAGTIDEYCEGKYTGPLPPEGESLYQMASGLHYIHQQQFIHRDIKPENILISFPLSWNSSVQLKISDFGFCKPVSVRGTMSLSGIRGTFRWLAPELLPFLGKEGLSERGNISSDVFSMGCVFGYFLTRGIHPFGQETFLVMARISEGNSDLSSNFLFFKSIISIL
jgi:serine/threonine protein kinase